MRALLLLLAFLALLASAGPAAAKSCGAKVIDDWFDGRIDGTYPLHCYDDAIEQLPRDVRDYSSAKEDIERALQARLRGETTPPNTAETDADYDNDDGTDTTGVVPPGGDDSSGPTSGDDPEAIPPGRRPARTRARSRLPLLLLAGLALLLVAGGAAGYIVRRVAGAPRDPLRPSEIGRRTTVRIRYHGGNVFAQFAGFFARTNGDIRPTPSLTSPIHSAASRRERCGRREHR